MSEKVNRRCATCINRELQSQEQPCCDCKDDLSYWIPEGMYPEPETPEDWVDQIPAKGTERPVILKELLPIYERPTSRIPDRIRISFSDGKTAVYDLHIGQPAPVIMENIRIIRRMKPGYVNQPARRRRRK